MNDKSLFQEFDVGQREKPVGITGTRDVAEVEYAPITPNAPKGYIKKTARTIKQKSGKIKP